MTRLLSIGSCSIFSALLNCSSLFFPENLAVRKPPLKRNWVAISLNGFCVSVTSGWLGVDLEVLCIVIPL